MKKIVSALVLLFLLAGMGITLASVYFYRTPGHYPEKTVVIAPQTGARAILAQLHAEGILPPPLLVALPLAVSHQYKLLKAGEYLFPADQSPSQVLHQIARGQVVVHQLTIPEGWNAMQVAAAFAAEPLMGGPVPAIAEGSVFPDTVRFGRGEDRGAVLARLQKERAVKLAEAWGKRDPNLPVTTPEQALVLASIVEKETGVPAERALVAGVFTNRLRLGMKLQSDPTVAYGIERALGHPLGRALTSADLAADTAYNSYTREGLPPGPICNPGQPAIEAALHPAVTDALYFVATGHGGHNFARTLESHEQNVVEYRKAVGKPIAPTPKAKTASVRTRRR